MLTLLLPITKEIKESGFPFIVLEDPYFFNKYNGPRLVPIL